MYDGISQVVSDGGGTIILSTDGTYSGSRPDAAIVVYGETPYAEGAGIYLVLSISLDLKLTLIFSNH
ncbi:MAG: hypothetical protein CM15mP51_09350 [Porticoccaceae bacterium]|nr:MAG: hypothetical protein CM15mP51_09350 [Porticoccaceae bacterium]